MNEVQHMKFAWLCMEDYAFWGYGDKDQPVPCLLINDIFVRGADAKQLSAVEVEVVYDIAKQKGMGGIIEWLEAKHGWKALQR